MLAIVIICYLIFINLFGLIIMKVDKERAKKGKYRIKESSLWKAAFLGGAIGTTAGMNMFRHKTKHTQFKWGFPLLAIIEAALYIWGLWIWLY
ncbi:DUF1294 domain-containing protein [Falsibacillus pallidus]|uniref:Uncharacterized membrane protein YsdA (DUF1294 family) n=1 Tax=Falsibacillus pallidus TaxID=493781 RepID=A0A370GP35_9BACI|nr:DUF1294 domain-containing protein [Falsibacillus pallidus]RDI44224.1 uncharacterized membrane protein YsdA (DUF1294 family) [Falsibacillus pallidus]